MIAASSKSVNRLRGILVLACLAVSGLAEQPMLEKDYMDQFLREHNISNTKPTVTAALSSNDAVVRRGASHVLSRRWPKEAAAPIREAMLREGDELIRVSLASDLAQLGDIAGREMLLADCHHSVWGSTRVLAARSMFALPDDSCLDAVLETLRLNSDPQDTMAKVDALDLVPDIIHYSGEQEYRNILDLTMNALNDPDAGVRLTATVTLGRLEETSAIAALQAALVTEQDPNNLSVVLGELKRLQESGGGPFRITIKAASETVVAGALIELHINLLNTSTETMVTRSGFQAYDGDPTYEYSCHNSSGNSVSKEINMVGNVHDAPSIKSGETYMSTVFLDRVCDLSRPGRYEIQVSRGLPMGSHDHIVKSNMILISVVQ